MVYSSKKPQKFNGSKLAGGLRTKNCFKSGIFNQPLVSIVTVVYNGQRYLEDTILSVINQSYPNVEYIIIDGGSSDASVDIIRNYDHLIDYWVSEPDDGIYDAMNKGIKLASGEIIGLINSDDYYNTDTVELVVHYFQKHSVNLVFGDKLMLNTSLGIKKIISVSNPTSLANLSVHVVHPTVFVSSLIYNKLTFNSDLRVAADYAFLLDAFNRGCTFGKIHSVLAVMRYGGISSKFNLEPSIITWKKIGPLKSFKTALRQILSSLCSFVFSYNSSFAKRFYSLRGWSIIKI